jgi:hypothetical protein
MFCGRCCVTEPRSRLALRLDIFIEILLRTRVNSALEELEDGLVDRGVPFDS